MQNVCLVATQSFNEGSLNTRTLAWFCHLFDVQVSSFSHYSVLFRRVEKKLSDFFLLIGFLHVFFTFIFWCFLKCYPLQ